MHRRREKTTSLKEAWVEEVGGKYLVVKIGTEKDMGKEAVEDEDLSREKDALEKI